MLIGIAYHGAEVRIQSARQLTLTRDARFGSAVDVMAGLEQPRIMTMDASGNVYIFDTGAQQVKVYDSRGRHLRNIGRRGAGPGEFGERTIPAAMGFLGDTLWISTGPPSYSIAFYPSGVWSHNITLSFDPRRMGVSKAPVTGMLSSGFALAQGVGLAAKGDTLAAQRSPVVLLRRDGTVADSIALPRVGEVTLRIGVIVASQWFRDDLLWAAYPDGSGAVLLDRSAPSRPDSAFFTLRRVDASGRTTANTSLRYSPVPLRREIVDSMMSALPELYGRAIASRGEEVRRNLVIPEFLPTVTRLLAGRDGVVWIQREATIEAGRRWSLVASNGVLIGNVRVPAGLQVIFGDRQALFAVEVDANDIPWVVRLNVGSGS
jgi:hypothetical protein